MHKLIVSLCILFLSACVSSACGIRSKPPAVAEPSVRAHMEFLASDAMNGRGSGTRDEWIAVTYIASQLLRWELEPLGDDGGYVQTIEIERPELAAPPVLTLGNRRFTHGQGISVTYMNSLRTTGTVERFDGGSPAPSGSVVVVAQFPPHRALLSAASVVLAKANGCGGFRVPASGLPNVAPRVVGAAGGAARPACVALDDEAYAAAEALAPGAAVSLEGEAKTLRKTNTWNAVGRLTGSDTALAQEVLLLSAHIDHVGARGEPTPGRDIVYNGADDDASGSIAVLELAEAFAKGERPKRTIVFAWFGSEESGGAGSRYFADKPVVPLDRIVANLQFEMIGRPDAKVPPHTLWLTGYERSNLGPELARRGAKLVQDPHPEQSFFTRSDNIQFARRGVIAHTVSSFGLHKDYHQPSDEIRTIDFAHMTAAIRSMVAPIRWLANSTFRPAWYPNMKP